MSRVEPTDLIQPGVGAYGFRLGEPLDLSTDFTQEEGVTRLDGSTPPVEVYIGYKPEGKQKMYVVCDAQGLVLKICVTDETVAFVGVKKGQSIDRAPWNRKSPSAG